MVKIIIKVKQIKLNTAIIKEIKTIVNNEREKMGYTVNSELLNTYWNIGRIIIKYEQKGNIKAEY